MHDVIVWQCLYMVVCAYVPQQRVESVVVYSLTVTDKYTLTTGVKKLNALYALFSPQRFLFSASLTFLSSPFYFLYFSLCHTLLLLLSLAISFFCSPPPSLHL